MAISWLAAQQDDIIIVIWISGSVLEGNEDPSGPLDKDFRSLSSKVYYKTIYSYLEKSSKCIKSMFVKFYAGGRVGGGVLLPILLITHISLVVTFSLIDKFQG